MLASRKSSAGDRLDELTHRTSWMSYLAFASLRRSAVLYLHASEYSAERVLVDSVDIVADVGHGELIGGMVFIVLFVAGVIAFVDAFLGHFLPVPYELNK